MTASRQLPFLFIKSYTLVCQAGHQSLFSGANICPDPRQRPLAKFEPRAVSQFGREREKGDEEEETFHFCGVFIGFKMHLLCQV